MHLRLRERSNVRARTRKSCWEVESEKKSNQKNLAISQHCPDSLLQHLLGMANCLDFHTKFPGYVAETLESEIKFVGNLALVNRGHPVVALFDAEREQRGKTPLSARPDTDFMFDAVQVHTMLAFLQRGLTGHCVCNDE